MTPWHTLPRLDYESMANNSLSLSIAFSKRIVDAMRTWLRRESYITIKSFYYLIYKFPLKAAINKVINGMNNIWVRAGTYYLNCLTDSESVIGTIKRIFQAKYE
jgi:hypothetical protein